MWDDLVSIKAMAKFTDLPPEMISTILEYLASDIPGYWGNFTDINNLLRASGYCLKIAGTVYQSMLDKAGESEDFTTRSTRWDWKVTTSFMTVDAEFKKKVDSKSAASVARRERGKQSGRSRFRLDVDGLSFLIESGQARTMSYPTAHDADQGLRCRSQRSWRVKR